MNETNIWHRDPAAYMSRWRCFPEKYWHLIVYDDGEWFIEKNLRQIANERARNVEVGKLQVLALYELFKLFENGDANVNG